MNNAVCKSDSTALMKNELQMMWHPKLGCAYRVLGKPWKTLNRRAGLWADIWTNSCPKWTRMLPTHLQCDYNTIGSEVYLMSGSGFKVMWELHWVVNRCYCLLINAVSIDDISTHDKNNGVYKQIHHGWVKRMHIQKQSQLKCMKILQTNDFGLISILLYTAVLPKSLHHVSDISVKWTH